jgi:hypothetical protein
MIHKFVKTTPKPNATKNSSGDDVGPVPGELVGDGDDTVPGDDDAADIDKIVDAVVGVALAGWVVDCVWISRSKT